MILVVTQMPCRDFRYALRTNFRKMRFAPNESTLRVCLIVFSICFGILSVSLIGLGIAHINELVWPRRYVGLDFVQLPTFVIILGAISLLLSFAGCYCAKSHNRKLYALFIMALFFIMALELTVSIIAFKNNSDERRERTLLLMEKQLTINSSNSYFKALEAHYGCCGILGSELKCAVVHNSSPITKSGCALKVNEALDHISWRIGYSTAAFTCFQIIETTCAYFIWCVMIVD